MSKIEVHHLLGKTYRKATHHEMDTLKVLHRLQAMGREMEFFELLETQNEDKRKDFARMSTCDFH